jgi:hypothetical protein
MPPIIANGMLAMISVAFLKRSEGVEQQHEDDQDRQRHHPGQARHGPLLVLEFARPADLVTLLQLDGLGDRLLHVLDHAAHVAVLDEDSDREHAPSAFARDVHGAAGAVERRDVLQRHEGAAGVATAISLMRASARSASEQPHRDREAALPFPDVAHLAAGQARSG